MTPEDHGPQAGCRAYECGIPEDASSCPYTVVGNPADPNIEFVDEEPTCTHEYRRVSMSDLDLRVYCIYCLTIETLSKT